MYYRTQQRMWLGLVIAIIAGLVWLVGEAAGQNETLFEYNQRRASEGLLPAFSVPRQGSLAEQAQRQQDKKYLEAKEERRRNRIRQMQMPQPTATPVVKYIVREVATTTGTKSGGVTISFSDEPTTKGKP